MSTTYKAQAIAHELTDRLKARAGLAALGLVESSDTDQNPLITIGALATTNEGAIIKVEPINWPLAQDILGNAAIQYTPHVVKILKEASPAGGLTSKDILEIQAQCAAMGTKIELYESSSGAGVVLADIDNAAKLVAEYETDAYRPMISSQ